MSAEPEALEEAVAVLAAGGVVVLPTDTVYGIAASLTNSEAVQRIFQIKQRPSHKPLPVLVPSIEEAMRLGRFSAEAIASAKEGWPGPLTVVVPAAEPLPQLGGDGLSVGLRMPADSFTLAVLVRCGPLACTSANPSGQPVGIGIDDIKSTLGDSIDLYVDGGRLESAPSRVVSFVGPTRVLR